MVSNESKLNIRPEIWISLFLVLSTLLIYFQVSSFGFVHYDTAKYVYENRIVKAGLTAEGFKWAFSSFYFCNWHPLTWLSHMLDVQLYGLHPGRHHLTNVIFHIVNTLLLFGVLRRMTGKLWQCGFVAALFALHPLHVESVAWVAERKDLLSSLFGLLTLWFYTRYVRKPSVSRYMPVILFFTLGLMAKPMVVTLPFLLLLLDYWPLRRLSVDRASNRDRFSNQRPDKWHLIVEKVPLFILSAASCIVTVLSQHSYGSIVSMDVYPLNIRIANALISYVNYIGKLFWPVNLAIIYPYEMIVPTWQIWVSSCLLVSLTLISVKSYKSRPWFPVGWFWFLGTLIPVIGFVQVGAQSMADRYTYVPAIGLFIIFAWGLFENLKRCSHRELKFTTIAVVFSGVLMVIAWKQIQYWQNGITLFQRAVNVSENSYIGHKNLGHALLLNGRFEEAAEHLTKTLELNPRSATSLVDLGLVLAGQNKPEEALQAYAKALAEEPDYAVAYNLAGKAHYQLGNNVQAVSNYGQAIKINPDYAEVYVNLGNALFRLGENDKAWEYYQQALEIYPDYAEAYNSLGNFCYHSGNIPKALSNYLKAVKINPKFAEAYNGAGAAFIKMGEVRKAVAFFRAALKIDPDNVAAQNNLKNTLAALEKSNGKTSASQ
jgi:tetratricopeptide (TPR) repeat protein